jgi:hypothetical protein
MMGKGKRAAGTDPHQTFATRCLLWHCWFACNSPERLA